MRKVDSCHSPKLGHLCIPCPRILVADANPAGFRPHCILFGVTVLPSWVNRFTLQRQNTKNTFVHTALRLATHKSLKPLNSECKFAKCQRSLASQAATTQAWAIQFRVLIGTISLSRHPRFDRRYVRACESFPERMHTRPRQLPRAGNLSVHAAYPTSCPPRRTRNNRS